MDFQSKVITINGEDFTVFEMSARQRQSMFKFYKDELDPVEIQANAIKMGCAEFRDKEIKDILDLPGKAFSDIADAVIAISGLADDSEKDAEKNS